MSETPDRPTGTVGAQLALSDLRAALATIAIPGQAHRPGSEPTAADVLHQHLQLIEHSLHQIEIYLV